MVWTATMIDREPIGFVDQRGTVVDCRLSGSGVIDTRALIVCKTDVATSESGGWMQPIMPGAKYFQCPATDPIRRGRCDRFLQCGWVVCPKCRAEPIYTPDQAKERLSERVVAVIDDNPAMDLSVENARHLAFTDHKGVCRIHTHSRRAELLEKMRRLYVEDAKWIEGRPSIDSPTTAEEERAKRALYGGVPGLMGYCRVAPWDPKDENDLPTSHDARLSNNDIALWLAQELVGNAKIDKGRAMRRHDRRQACVAAVAITTASLVVSFDEALDAGDPEILEKCISKSWAATLAAEQESLLNTFFGCCPDEESSRLIREAVAAAMARWHRMRNVFRR